MRKTIKLFLDEIIQKMPQYSEVVRENIMGWIGFLNEDDTDFAQGYGEYYDYDNYMSMYKTLSEKINKKIHNLEITKGLSTNSITYGLQFVEEGHLEPFVDTFRCFFTPDNENFHNIPKEDLDMFSSLYDKHILGK